MGFLFLGNNEYATDPLWDAIVASGSYRVAPEKSRMINTVCKDDGKCKDVYIPATEMNF